MQPRNAMSAILRCARVPPRQSAAMRRLPLIPRILLVILAVQAGLFAALAAASLNAIRRDIGTETRLATETARALVLATIGTMQGAVPPDRLMAALPQRLSWAMTDIPCWSAQLRPRVRPAQ